MAEKQSSIGSSVGEYLRKKLKGSTSGNSAAGKMRDDSSYQDYVAEQQANGNEYVSREEFAKGMR